MTPDLPNPPVAPELTRTNDADTRRLSVRIDKDIKHAAERAADKAHQSLAYYVETALSDKLAKGDQA